MLWKWSWSFLHLVVCCANIVSSEQKEDFVAVSLGNAALLHCELEFPGGVVQPYTVHWLKQGHTGLVYLWQEGRPPVIGGGYEGRISLAGPASLNISNIKTSDLGWYECRIFVQSSRNDELVQRNSTLVHVEILDPGFHFVEEPKSDLLLPGSRIELRCQTSPPTDIRWDVNGKLINPGYDPDIELRNNSIIVKFSNTRPSYRPSVGGLYRCISVLGNLAVSSLPANISVATLEEFPRQDDINLFVPEGSVAVIPCPTPTSIPSGTLQLERDAYTVPISGHINRLQSEAFKFMPVSKKDEGSYRCSLVNTVLNRKVTAQHKINLIVTGHTGPRAPQLLAKPSRSLYAVAPNGNLTLECVVSGFPPPHVAWMRYSGNLPPARHTQRGGTLELTGIQKSDEGTYVCTADNGLGSAVTAHTSVEIQEKPSIIDSLKRYNQTVLEGSDISLHCSVMGVPKPSINWYHNGALLKPNDTVIIRDYLLTLRSVTLKSIGLYQCIATNDLGSISSTARIRVIPKKKGNDQNVLENGLGNANKSNTDHGNDLIFGSLNPNGSARGHSPHQHKNNRKWKHRHRHKHNKESNYSHTSNGEALMVPPSRPIITKLSDESVMVRWQVPDNDGLPITFFKLQYKIVSKKHSRWMTIDDEIAPHIHSFEVPNLKSGHTYRFRIAAVYSNFDNKQGPNSAKFLLQKESTTGKPTIGPVIIEAEAVSRTAIKIHWQYVDMDMVPIEGFFIYYRSTTSAGDYSKVPVIGANTRYHIIDHLLPGESYDVKMQSFNKAGTSEFSNIVKQKTMTSGNFIPVDQEAKIQTDSPATTTSSSSSSNDLLSTILGAVLGCMVIILISFMIFCGWKQRQQRLQFLAALDRTNENLTTTPSSLNKPLQSNGHGRIGNGHVMLDQMNISVNPLSEHEMAETSLSQPPDERWNGRSSCNRAADQGTQEEQDTLLTNHQSADTGQEIRTADSTDDSEENTD